MLKSKTVAGDFGREVVGDSNRTTSFSMFFTDGYELKIDHDGGNATVTLIRETP